MTDLGGWKAVIFYQAKRLEDLGWQPIISTSTHFLFYKKKRECAINRDTGQMCFKRILSIDTVETIRGPVEKGIE